MTRTTYHRKSKTLVKKYVMFAFFVFLSLEVMKHFVFRNKFMRNLSNALIGPAEVKKRRVLPSENELKRDFPIFCLVMCEPIRDDLTRLSASADVANKPDRQLNQAINVIKSAASLTKLPYLNFIIVVDEYWIYEELLEEISKWPKDIQEKLVFQRRGIWYPDIGRDFRALFRVCATERLFLPDHFTDVDALIYLDTDVLFMRPPEELWNHFKYFEPRHVSGIVPCLYYYGDDFTYPFYGESGLNVGLWLMNMTRMRDFPGGWTNQCVITFDEYGWYLGLPTQDITNIVFSKFPERLYEVGCEWNYRRRLCAEGKSLPCEIEDKGVHLIHGADLVFFDNKDEKFRKFYEAWDEYEVGAPLQDLLFSLRQHLEEVDLLGLKSKCKEFKNIDNVLTKGLEDHIKDL